MGAEGGDRRYIQDLLYLFGSGGHGESLDFKYSSGVSETLGWPTQNVRKDESNWSVVSTSKD